jgi:hypothetical protein
MNRVLVLGVVTVVGAALVVSSQAAKAPDDNGIYVGNPKVYDDAALEYMLKAAQAKVAQLSGFDQTSLTKNLGTLQGASADQSQVAAQVSGLPKPGATAQAVSPVSPTQPTLPAFTLPSSFSPSAADLLNEQTQLNFQLSNLQLLLEGALSDQFVEGTTVGKPRVTLGFPITVTVPPGFQYREAVAEVEISVCSPPGSYSGNPDDKSGNAPSLMNLIPQEKIYNVASIVSNTASIGGGAIAGVLNFGGGLLRGRQTFYIVQDVDTLAIPRPSRVLQCPAQVVAMKADLMKVTNHPSLKFNAVTFAWQFRPVLGQNVVRDGTRQTFAQISMPPPLQPVACSTTVYAQSRWRRYDLKTGRVGYVIPGTEGKLDIRQVASYDQAPSPRAVTAEDNGDGTVTVKANGTFKAGTKVRIGSQILDSTNPLLFDQNATDIRFTASGTALALVGARLVNRDGSESPVQPGQEPPVTSCSAPLAATDAKATKKHTDKKAAAEKKAADKAALEKAAAEKAAAEKKAADKAALEKAAAEKAAAEKAAAEKAVADKAAVTVKALTDSTSTVTIMLTGDDQPKFGEIPVVVIGNQVFGLRNNPFLEGILESGHNDHVKLVVANDLLRANRTLKWVRLFDASQPHEFPIPKVSGFVSFASPAITLLSSGLLSSGLPPKETADKSAVTPPATPPPAPGVSPPKDSADKSTPVPPATPQPVPAVTAPKNGADKSTPVLPVPSPSPPAVAPPKDGADRSAPAPAPAKDTETEKPPTFSRYAIAGQHMQGLKIVSPENTHFDNIPNTDTLKTFSLQDTVAAKLKSIIVQKDDEAPIVLPLPAPPAPAPASGSTTAKTSINPQKPPPIAASSKTLDLTGTGMDQVVAVFYNLTPLPFTAPTDKTLTLTFLGPQGTALAPALSSPGITVVFVYADKSLVPYFIPVAAAAPAH